MVSIPHGGHISHGKRRIGGTAGSVRGLEVMTYPFDEENTKEQDFYKLDGTTIKCDMMSLTRKFAYFETNDFQAIKLPYGELKYSMIVILPKDEKNVEDIINQLDKENQTVLWADKLIGPFFIYCYNVD